MEKKRESRSEEEEEFQTEERVITCFLVAFSTSFLTNMVE